MSQRTTVSLEERLLQLMDRLDIMAEEQRALQEQNERLRAALERRHGAAPTSPDAWGTGASPARHAPPVERGPQPSALQGVNGSHRPRVAEGAPDLSASWLNAPVDTSPHSTWTGPVAPEVENDDLDPSAGLGAPIPGAPAQARAFRPVQPRRETLSQPEATARSVSSRFGRGLEPDELERVVPREHERVPRHDMDLGYVNRVEAEELNKLPYGLIILDLRGQVLFYNETEARYAGYRPERVVGRSFFEDIAPCTRVKEFQGRFNDFVAGRLGRVHFFDFVFNFEHGAQSVLIGLSPGRRPGQVNVMLTRQ